MSPTEGKTLRLTATTGGDRLDRYVAKAIPDLSRTAVKRLIEAEDVTLNATSTRPAQRLHEGDVITVHIPPPEPVDIVPESLPLSILYEDAHILVVNKAPGMVVHPGAGNTHGTLVNAILAHCPDLQGVGGKLRPGIVHRLDKDTSGVLVVAKNDKAIHQLQQQFKQRTVQKTYQALLVGRLKPLEGFINAPIGRHPVHRKRMAVIAGGRPSRTRWDARSYWLDAERHTYTFVHVALLTGRTHQIRVHFSWLGYPLVGDRKYGRSRQPIPAPRQFLHAHILTVQHPDTEETLTFTAPLPEDLDTVLQSLDMESTKLCA